MTSLLRSSRQVSTDGGYYISLSSLVSSIHSYDSATHTLDRAEWTLGSGGSTISTLGCLLKDAGKTVVSSGRTFRKIQVVSRQEGAGLDTFGVGGDVATADGADYLTGYIELGFEGSGKPALVAQFGR
jgi:hypothetical protein